MIEFEFERDWPGAVALCFEFLVWEYWYSGFDFGFDMYGSCTIVEDIRGFLLVLLSSRCFGFAFISLFQFISYGRNLVGSVLTLCGDRH